MNTEKIWSELELESGIRYIICSDFDDVLEAFKTLDVKKGDSFIVIDMLKFTTIYTFNGMDTEKPFDIMLIPGRDIDKDELNQELKRRKEEYGGGYVQRQLPSSKPWHPVVRWEEF